MKRILPVIVSVLAVTASAQGPDTLDLTQLRTSTSGAMTAGTSTGSAEGVSSHSAREQLRVHMRLEWLDRAAYRYGEPLTFRLTLRNVGREPVAIPWEPDPARLSTGPDAPLQRALLALDVDFSDGRASIPVAVLYGSKLSPGNMKVLQSGQVGEVLGAATWEFRAFTGDDVRAGFNRSVDVSARLDFLTPINGRVYANMRSVNRVRIALVRPRSD
jgi:hypothetical protein